MEAIELLKTMKAAISEQGAYSGERERSFWCIVNAFTPLSIASFNF